MIHNRVGGGGLGDGAAIGEAPGASARLIGAAPGRGPLASASG